MDLINLLGLIGGGCFAYACVPSSYLTIKAGKSIGVPVNMAWLIFSGTVFLYTYLFLRNGFDTIITINYSVEALSWLVILKYHYFPTKD